MSEENKKTFEESITRLQEIAQILDSQEVDVETSIKLYEEGIVLAKECYKQLKDAELKITNLKKQLEDEIND